MLLVKNFSVGALIRLDNPQNKSYYVCISLCKHSNFSLPIRGEGRGGGPLLHNLLYRSLLSAYDVHALVE